MIWTLGKISSNSVEYFSRYHVFTEVTSFFDCQRWYLSQSKLSLSLIKLPLCKNFWEFCHDFLNVVWWCYLLILGKICFYSDKVWWGRYWLIVSLLRIRNILLPVRIFLQFGGLKMLQSSQKFYWRWTICTKVTSKKIMTISKKLWP